MRMGGGSTTKLRFQETCSWSPRGTALAGLEDNYERMRATGMLLEDDQPFEQITKQCAALEERANRMESKHS